MDIEAQRCTEEGTEGDLGVVNLEFHSWGL